MQYSHEETKIVQIYKSKKKIKTCMNIILNCLTTPTAH